MLTLHGLGQAHALAEDLRRVRAAFEDIKQDTATRCDLRVHGLRRTYGTAGDTHQVAAPVQKSRVLAVLADEEAEIVTILRDMGVAADSVLEWQHIAPAEEKHCAPTAEGAPQ